MMRTKTFHIGITGHRDLGNAKTQTFVCEEIKKLLLKLQEEHRRLNALSALAEGADTIFAREALELGIPLIAVIPFAEYEDDFTKRESLEQFKGLLQQAEKVIRLDYRHRSDKAYLEGGKWVVDHSDLLCAVWNGKPAAGKGGTGDVVAYALNKSCPVIHIDVSNHLVKKLHL